MINRSKVVTTIGKTFADKLEEVVVNVSQDLSFTKREMVEEVGCANFLAAYRLSRVLRRLNIYTAAKLFHTDPQSIVRCKGIGETSIFVAMCILDVKGYDVEKWWGWKETNELKFSSFKHKAIRRASRSQHEV